MILEYQISEEGLILDTLRRVFLYGETSEVSKNFGSLLSVFKNWQVYG